MDWKGARASKEARAATAQKETMARAELPEDRERSAYWEALERLEPSVVRAPRAGRMGPILSEGLKHWARPALQARSACAERQARSVGPACQEWMAPHPRVFLRSPPKPHLRHLQPVAFA
jgi:hypothetical protein